MTNSTRQDVLRIELRQLEALLLTASRNEADLLCARKMQIQEELGLHRPSHGPGSCRAA